jgi:tetraacyldisaccharide 4'-kinase
MQRQWQHGDLWQVVLLPLSWLFRLLTACRRQAYAWGILKSYRLSVPVVVVGNLSVGGTGKTPLVIWLVQRLRQEGLRPGVVSRGYGRMQAGVCAVDASSTAAEVGDEPLLIHRRGQCPVWVGSDRVAACRALLATYPECEVIVSDDGLQHYRMQRDVELVVVDAERRFGNGRLFPAGPLREPIRRLKRVDALIYNGGTADCDGYAMRLCPGPIINLSDGRVLADLGVWRGRKIHAVAGIGNPQRFFRQLEELGLTIETHVFPDHHAYEAADLAFADDAPLLMTEKDAVKCAGFAGPDWWYLPVEAEIDAALAAEVVRKLGK